MMGSNGHQEEGEEVMVVKKMVGEEVEDIEVLQQELVSLDEEAEEKKVAGRKLPSWKPDPLLPAGWKKREVEMQVFVSDFKMYLSQIDKCICLKFQFVFVSNCKMYLSQITKSICLKFQNVFWSGYGPSPEFRTFLVPLSKRSVALAEFG